MTSSASPIRSNKSRFCQQRTNVKLRKSSFEPIKPWSNYSFNKKSTNLCACLRHSRASHLSLLFFFLSQHKINKPVSGLLVFRMIMPLPLRDCPQNFTFALEANVYFLDNLSATGIILRYIY